MSELKATLALGGEAPARASFGDLTLVENADLVLASLALRRGAARPTPFGLTLPDPGHWTGTEGIAAFWIGPDQWMVESEGAVKGDFSGLLKATAADCSVTEQTDAWVAFEVTSSQGPAPLVRLLEKLVNLDAADFGPGRVTRSAIDHMGCHVIRRTEDRLAILGMRSMAGSLWHALTRAASR